MRIVKDINLAMAVTHGGTFHCDEVMATVILELYHQAIGINEMTVCRVNRYDPQEHPGHHAYVYDIGGGNWDHHQRGGNGSRDNGIPYSSCGLIWRDFGMTVCDGRWSLAETKAIWQNIDKDLIQPIDSVDCGTMPRTDYPVQPLTVSSVISAFNPNWDDNLDLDCAFRRAFDYAYATFHMIYNRAVAKVKAANEVYKILDGAKDPRIMILEKYLPWIDIILNPDDNHVNRASKVLVGIYPAHRGGYQWRTVPDREGSYGMRAPAPTKWWGQSGDAIREITGVKTANFCHPNGFIGGAETLEDAITMATLLVNGKTSV